MINIAKHLFFALVTLGLMLISMDMKAQVPNCLWAFHTSGTSVNKSFSTAVDNNGNVFAVGTFGTPSITFGTFTLNNSGAEDVFIVKYDASGIVLWARSAGGADPEMAYSIKCDVNGSIYAAGTFESDSITFGTITLVNSGMKDIFIVKYDSSGNVTWARSYGGNGDDFANALALDINGNLYATGNFTSPSITFGSTVLYAVGTSKIYIVKFDSGGNAIWAKGSEGPSYDAGKCVTVDDSGNVYITGEYYQYSVILGTDTFSNQGEDDIYVVKYDSGGNQIWASVFGGFDPDKATGIVKDVYGKIYITGHFFSPFIQFGSTTLNNAGFGAWDMYLVKLDDNGNVMRAQSASGNGGEDVPVGIAADNSGCIYLTGWFSDSITFGAAVLNSMGTTDLFTVKYDSAGTALWAFSNGGNSDDFTTGIALEDNGSIYETGYFKSSSLVFGNIALNNPNAGWVMFAVKFGDSPNAVKLIADNSEGKVYPNPNKGKFYLSGLNNEEKQIKVYSELGKCIYQSELKSDSEIDLTGNPKGIYLIDVISKDKRYSLKILME